jgi:hypothetical protein
VPGQPSLVASGPSTAIVLVPGQGPIDVPITATNNGTAPSPPVTATLNLPPGVTALAAGTTAAPTAPAGQQAPAFAPGRVNGTPPSPAIPAAPAIPGGPGARGGHVFARSVPMLAAIPPTSQVDCPGGAGTVTCSSPTGLAPGQSVVLMFRLVAAPGTQGGQITGTVGDGGSLSVSITVTVQVPPALSAHIDQSDHGWWSWFLFDTFPVLDATVTNTGTSTKPVTFTADRPGSLWSAEPGVTCNGQTAAPNQGAPGGGGPHLRGRAPGGSITCTTDQAVAPTKTAHVRIRLYDLDERSDTVTATATLGTATQSAQLTVTAPGPCLLGLLCADEPTVTTPPSATEPGTTTEPSPTTPAPTTSKGKPTPGTTTPAPATSGGPTTADQPPNHVVPTPPVVSTLPPVPSDSPVPTVQSGPSTPPTVPTPVCGSRGNDGHLHPGVLGLGLCLPFVGWL